MALDNRLRALIAVGASIGANCQPCLARTVEMATEHGADGPQIAEAVQIGRRVRRGAATKMDEFAGGLLSSHQPRAAAVTGVCACDGETTQGERRDGDVRSAGSR